MTPEQWIPFSESVPPETHTEYRCGFSDSVLMVTYAKRTVISNYVYPRNGVKPFAPDHATRWMPLPKLPE